MRIVLIGAGNMATNLGKALKAAGHTIVQVYSRTMESASRLSDILGCTATAGIDDITAEAEAYIISVKDMALADIADRICHKHETGIFMHTAGSISMDVFADKAGMYGVIYPMQTLSRDKEVNFRNIPVFVEANNSDTLEKIRSLADSISNRVYELSSANRSRLHLAAVFASNFVNHCYEMSSEVLESCGIPFDVMLPLIDETSCKVHTMSPREAQTGPALRYDRNVIDAHLKMLDEGSMLKQVYELMSKSIHETAVNKV